MNARMLQFIRSSNSPESVRLANRKLATKRALQKAGLATPRLFGIIRTPGDLRRFRWTKLPSSFVLKPNSASGGGGIVVIFGRNKKGNWVKADKTEVFIPELRRHTLDILDGNFSASNIPDIAFFEQRVKVHADLKPYSVRGVPDVRVLVYNFVPVMAMLRLPTAESGGRANLHSGGIGVGIDLATGTTTHAIQRGSLIDTLPGSRQRLAGITVPYWNDILLLASRASEAANLRYAGVDVAIDREDGPLVLEINARPGLEIQFANVAPLKTRLRRIEGLSLTNPQKRISVAKSLFGDEHLTEQHDSSNKPVLGILEKVTLFDSDGQPHTVLAKIDTGAYRTAINETLAQQLNIHQPIIRYADVRGALGKQTRPVVKARLKIHDRNMATEVYVIDRSHMNYEMILGRRDLDGFLVDPVKNAGKTLK